jgi:hypothetical protein
MAPNMFPNFNDGNVHIHLSKSLKLQLHKDKLSSNLDWFKKAFEKILRSSPGKTDVFRFYLEVGSEGRYSLKYGVSYGVIL